MIQYDPGSFKDPAGRVFRHDGSIYRTASTAAIEAFTLARNRGLWRTLEHERLIVGAELVRTADAGLPEAEVGAWLIRQPAVSFVSYSCEWSFEMLRDAALATLRIIDHALSADFILKDANAFNILFDRNTPRLIDVPSLEPYRDGALWAGYAQFCRSFLFPLLVAAYRDVDVRALLRATVGELSVQQTVRLLRPRDYLRPGVLTDVVAQARLERTFGRSGPDVRASTAPVHYPKRALLSNVRRLITVIEKLRAPSRPAEWTRYGESHSYSDVDRSAKAAFVHRAIAAQPRGRLADLGCNTGEYSRIALDAGCDVIALDVDAPAIDRLYRGAAAGADLSPVVASLLNPTPAMGWALEERRPLLERLRADRFLALALLHHLRITGGVPLDRIVAQLFAIAPEGVVEWVDRDDGMVRQMLALRPDVYDDYTWPRFEALLRESGEIVAIQESHGGRRRLCHVRRDPDRSLAGQAR